MISSKFKVQRSKDFSAHKKRLMFSGVFAFCYFNSEF